MLHFDKNWLRRFYNIDEACFNKADRVEVFKIITILGKYYLFYSKVFKFSNIFIEPKVHFVILFIKIFFD